MSAPGVTTFEGYAGADPSFHLGDLRVGVPHRDTDMAPRAPEAALMNPNHSLKRIGSGSTSPLRSGRPLVGKYPSASDELSIDRAAFRVLGLPVNTFPADERRISEVERGRSCNAILPLPPGNLLSVGDSIIFALAVSRADQEPCLVKGGDSVRVFLTDVTDLGETDPLTGRALYHLSWEPLGQIGSPDAISKRVVKRR